MLSLSEARINELAADALPVHPHLQVCVVNAIKAALRDAGPKSKTSAATRALMVEAAAFIRRLTKEMSEAESTHDLFMQEISGLEQLAKRMDVAAHALLGDASTADAFTDAVCPRCNESTQSEAGDPGMWPVGLHYKGNGKAVLYHQHCVSDALRALEAAQSWTSLYENLLREALEVLPARGNLRRRIIQALPGQRTAAEIIGELNDIAGTTGTADAWVAPAK